MARTTSGIGIFVAILGLILWLTPGSVLLGPSQQQVSGEYQSIVEEAIALARPDGLRSLASLPLGSESASIHSAPLAQGGPDVLLQPADVGPNFILISSGVKVQQGVSLRVNTLRQAGKHIYYIEPDGVLFVRSLAVAAGDAFTADGIFNSVGKELFEGTQEVPVPAIGDRTRAAIEWGEKPFEAAGKIVMFRRGSVVGYVIVIAYEAPEQMSDIVPLAQKMASRAR
jgi:hypothetical protein